MAKFVYTNAFALIGGQDLSQYVVSLTTNFKIDQQDATAMNAGSAKSYLPGMSDGTFEFEFLQDFSASASATDQALFTVWSGRTPFAIEVRPVNAVRSTANPATTGTVYLFEYASIDAQVGQVAKVKATFVQTGAAIARATS